MLRLRLLSLLCFIAFVLSGCAMASQVEDQAYVLLMGLDRLADGNMEMTVKIPKISGSMGESGSSGKNENYMQMSVTAEDFESALEKLDWAAPRNVNLAQLKLIVVSESLAKENDFGRIIANIAQTERLFTATKVAVCEGKAKEFVSAIQPNVGTRISTDIEAMFDHYNDRGYVPESSLADLYYQTESVYSDPMVTYALLNEKAQAEQKNENIVPAFAFDQGLQQISDEYESDIATRYMGSAVFSGGKMEGVLNGAQTVLVNLLRNELDSFRYKINEQSLQFVPTRPVYLSVDTDTTPIRLTANIKLSYAAQEITPNESELKIQLTRDIEETIAHTQQLGVEPFGFAERTAKNFLTLRDWIDFDWKNKYKNAQLEIKLHFAQSDA